MGDDLLDLPKEATFNPRVRVEGFFWHLECLHGVPGSIRPDDGSEPDRGTWIDRAITMGEARRLDERDSQTPHCHVCKEMANHKNKKAYAPGETHEDFIVLSYKLTADLCRCKRDPKHKGERKVANHIWMDAPAMGTETGGKMAEILVCGDCWYRDNNLPPDERKTLPSPIKCTVCGDPTTEVVVLARVPAPSDEVVDPQDVEYDDDPSDYKIVVQWERMTERKEYYEFTISDPDSDDLAMVKDGDFDEVAWEIAADNSDEVQMDDYEDMGFCDDGPMAISFTIKER